MEYLLRTLRHPGPFGWLYTANFFLAFHFFVVHYINSSFASTLVPEEQVGLIFATGSALALVVLGASTLVLRRAGAWRTILAALSIQCVILLALASVANPLLLLVLFTLHLILEPIALFGLDIVLEGTQKSEESTGNVRGTFLTVAMVASLFSPLLAGLLVGAQERYAWVYVASALFLVPVAAIIALRFKGFQDPPYSAFRIRDTLARVRHDADVRAIAYAQFLMRFFFAWMVIYLPLYLRETIGFTWPEVGLILTIMLVPYIFVEIPAGIIADRWLGEKELLMTGFFVASGSTALLFFVTSPSLTLWAAILFVSRIGTALIEITTESYFFKHVGARDADTISFFRMLRPAAYALGPLSASAVLAYTTLPSLWPILAAILLTGPMVALKLTDTR